MNQETNETKGATGVPLDKIVRPMRYAVEQRLRFIDFLAHQYGRINRSALVDYFGISVPQATTDLKAYMKLAPDNIRYVRTDKAYRSNPEFKRIWA